MLGLADGYAEDTAPDRILDPADSIMRRPWQLNGEDPRVYPEHVTKIIEEFHRHPVIDPSQLSTAQPIPDGVGDQLPRSIVGRTK